MSAIALSHEHIHVLLWAADKFRGIYTNLTWYYDNPSRIGQLRCDNVDEIGQMLIDTNIAAANHRRSPAQAPEPPSEYRYRRPQHTTWSIIEILSALECFVYQCADLADWETSEANAFCRALQDTLIRALPRYNDGPWAITSASVPLQPPQSS